MQIIFHKKARKLVLFNITEFSTTVPANKCNDTSNFLIELFNPIGLTVHPISVYRLANVLNKSCFLWIVLPTPTGPTDIFWSLQVKRKLRNVNKCSSDRVSSNQTVILMLCDGCYLFIYFVTPKQSIFYIKCRFTY